MEEEKKVWKTLLQELCQQLVLTLTKADGLQIWRKASTIKKLLACTWALFYWEDHSYIATLLERVRSENTSGKCLKTVKAAIRHHLVNVQILKKSLQNFVRRKRMRDTPFSFLCSCRFRQQSQQSEELREKLEARRDLLPCLSDVFHHGRVAGLLVFENWWQDWRSP